MDNEGAAAGVRLLFFLLFILGTGWATRLSVYIISFFQTEGLLKHVLFVFGNGFFNIFPQFFGQAHNINIQKASTIYKDKT